MEIVSLTRIRLDPEIVAKQLRMANKEFVRRLINTAQAGIAPVAAFGSHFVDEKFDDGVVVDDVVFTSRVLRHNLDGVGRVFPFVLTIGKTIDEIIDLGEDMLEKYLLDEIGNMALQEARIRLEEHIRSVFALEKISCMAPGSLEDWPLEQQKPLFSLLPELEATIGVRLTENFLMLPCKTISGIYFPTKTTFFSCQLCPRERCDSRKAKYDSKKARSFGVLK